MISKFPGSEPAAHAQFSIAALDEAGLGQLAEAIDLFKKITVEPWRSQARQRVAVMESKSLVVITPRTFRSGETARLKIATRNIEDLNFTAYKLNAEAYFRKKNGLEKVESLDIGLVAPDASWTAKVADYARYKPTDTEYDLPKLELPGVFVVKVTDEKTLQATTLVIGSDLDAIVKTSRDQLLVFAQDMKTGKGRPSSRVLVAESGQVVLDAETGADGVLLKDWSPARAGNGRLSYLVVDGPHVAGSGLGVPDRVAQGLSPRAYIYTDRPAYRPGQHGLDPRRGSRGRRRPIRLRPPIRLPVRGGRQPGKVDRGASDRALRVRHIPRDPPARSRCPRRHLPCPGLPAGQERFLRNVRGPVLPARADRPLLRPQEDRLLPRRNNRSRSRGSLPVRRTPWPTARSRSRCPTGASCMA